MRTVKQILLVFLAVCSVAVLAKDSPIEKMSVTADFTVAPDVSYRDHNTFSPRVPSDNKWLMLKIQYTPESQKDFSPVARYRKNSGMQITFPGWLDDVELKTWIVYDTGVTVRGIPIRVLLTGSCRFHSIKADGKSHLALMFVPARLLDRYCSNWSGTGKPGKNSFYVKTEMFCGGRSLEAAYSSNVSGKNNAAREREFEKMQKHIPENLKVANAVLSRSRSPWALLAPDNFDLEVENGVGAAQE